MTPLYNFEKMRILHVDANRFMHDITVTILNAMHISEIRYAATPEEARTLINEFPPDLLMTELLLEPEDGFSFINGLRRNRNNDISFLPILAISSLNTMESVIRARDAGVSEFLAKPVSVKLLHDRLVWMIEKPRPFIKADGFVGPDRRRAMRGYPGTDKREDGSSGASPSDEALAS